MLFKKNVDCTIKQNRNPLTALGHSDLSQIMSLSCQFRVINTYQKDNAE